LHVAAFCAALKEKVQDKGSNFGKEYLKLLVEERSAPDGELKHSLDKKMPGS
jgi:hypothetical protein